MSTRSCLLGIKKFKVLMEHLDPDEEDEEGEASASANIRNKAINALLGGTAPLPGPSPRNQAGPETDDDDSDGDERTPGVSEVLQCIHVKIHAYISKKKSQFQTSVLLRFSDRD